MTIGSRINSFLGIDKRFLRNKLKKELKKYDDTIQEMIAYESAHNYICTIMENLNPKTKKTFLKKVYEMHTLNSEDLLLIAKETQNKNLYNILKKENVIFNYVETTMVLKMLKAQHNKLPKSKIKNIAFSGGGAKGIAHIGTIRALEENGVKIEAVSGTSAGAITALPYALGYSPDKIATIVVGYDFTSFLQESLLNKSPILSTVAKLSSSSRALMYRSDYFENFVKELKKPLLKYLILKNKHEKILDIKYSKDMSIEERMNHLDDHIINGNISLEQRRKIYSAATETDLNSILNIAEQKAMKYFIKRVEANEKDINPRELKEKLSLGFKNHEEALKTFFRISKSEDVIEEFFGDLIERKISAIPNEILEQVEEGFSSLEKIRNMNFKQFEKLRELCPDRNFKELGICICRKESDLPHKVFSKDNYKQIDVHANSEDKEYSEMSIKTAVRISMNLPGAFSSYKYKGKSYVDGGVRANFPLHFFDKTKKAVKETTIGFALAPEENYARTTDINNLCNPESPVELMETGPFKRFIKKQFIAASHFYNRKIYGQKLDNNEPFIQSDLLRVGFINVLNVGTNDFNISIRGKQKLMQQGYNSCKDLLSPRYEAQLFHYKERVRAINNKINHIEGLLMNIDKSKGNTKNEDFIKELECENKYNILEHLNNPKINEIIEREEKKQSFTKKIKGKRL